MAKVILLTIECFRKDFFNKKTVPNLFNLSKDGTLFENAYSTGPWTPASFIGILTSSYPLMYGEDIQLSEKTVSIAEILKNEGYKTAAFTVGGWLSSYFNFVKGFEYFVYSQEEKEGGISEKIKRASSKIKGAMYRMLPKLREFYRLFYLIIKSRDEKSRDEFQIRRSLEWIEKNKDRDFFVWIHLEDSHEPYFKGGTTFEKVKANYNLFKSKKELNRKEIDLIKKLYKEGLRSVDENIYRFIERLKKIKVFEESYIIICGDHGQELYDRTSCGHGPDFYQENINIPLLILGREIKKIKENREVSLIDIPPTIVELLKIKKPKEFLGASLINSKRRFVISEDARKQNLMSPDMDKIKYDFRYQKVALIYKNYKYIHKKFGRDEFYNFRRDPKEKSNLIAFDSKIKERLRREIEKHIKFEEQTRKSKSNLTKKEGKKEKESDKEKAKARLRELGYIK